MPAAESRRMVGGPLGTVLCAVAGIVLFGFGFFSLAVCGSGLSLILFGATVFAFGLAIFPAGGPVLLGMSGFLAFLLAVVGLIFAHGAACSY
jgi:hypothetical protein